MIHDNSRPIAAPLRCLAGIGFDGPDAAAFLHSQLSTDVEGMAVGAATWTSYNSPKGRMLATALLWRRGQEAFVAYVAADLAEALRKRLAMFVLRSKVAVTDRAAGRILLGVAGPDARGAVEAAFGSAPEHGRGHAGDDADIVATPDGRYLVDAPAASPGAARMRLSSDSADASFWDWLGVRAGIPQITRATQDLFVPQTTNFDLVGGINFRKGCYPGQEIVARMQYLGRLKERLFAFHVDGAPPAAGSRVHGQPASDAVGTVVNAAPSPTGGSDLVAVVSWSAVEAGGLRAGGPDGPAMTPLDLPYTVPKPAAPSRVKL